MSSAAPRGRWVFAVGQLSVFRPYRILERSEWEDLAPAVGGGWTWQSLPDPPEGCTYLWSEIETAGDATISLTLVTGT